ncbi:MAG: class I SAM-dependent methyltransferase [Candidatus Krumholzibacteriota bacterium]|nr:class I SAM-dependent methyltransferase [Candidatus Krumholzibacteriota bacterium]
MEEKKEKYWSRFPDTYDENQGYVVGKELLGDISEKLNDLSTLGEVVEFGCGTGYFSEIISQKANRMISTDLSDELLDKAKARLGDDSRITIQRENCIETSFSSDSFDAVLMANLIHVIEDPVKALQESHRILKVGGVLIIVTFTSYGLGFFDAIRLSSRYLRSWGRPPRHMHRFSPESLASLVESAGFSINESVLLGSRTKAIFIVGQKKQL